VILGDNIIDNVCRRFRFSRGRRRREDLLKEGGRTAFGVAELRGNHVIGIEEKPGNPKSTTR